MNKVSFHSADRKIPIRNRNTIKIFLGNLFKNEGINWPITFKGVAFAFGFYSLVGLIGYAVLLFIIKGIPWIIKDMRNLPKK